MPKTKIKLQESKRNGALIDRWSFVHFATSAALTVIVGPVYAFIIVTLWEPFEIFVLSRFLANYGVVFGHEKLRNSLSDIVFNSLGISFAALYL